MHGVLILRGSGHCLVGDEVKSLDTNDLVTIAPMTWHQMGAEAPSGPSVRLAMGGYPLINMTNTER